MPTYNGNTVSKIQTVALDVEKFVDNLRFLRLHKHVPAEMVEYQFNYLCNMHRSVNRRRNELYARLMQPTF